MRGWNGRTGIITVVPKKKVHVWNCLNPHKEVEIMTDEEPEKKTYRIVYQNDDVVILFRDRSADGEEE